MNLFTVIILSILIGLFPGFFGYNISDAEWWYMVIPCHFVMLLVNLSLGDA